MHLFSWQVHKGKKELHKIIIMSYLPLMPRPIGGTVLRVILSYYTARTNGGWKAPGTRALARPREPAGFQPGDGLFPERDSNRFGLFPAWVWDQQEEPPGF